MILSSNPLFFIQNEFKVFRIERNWGNSGIPRNSSKITLGNSWGQGELKHWGFLGRNSPKIVEFRGGEGDKNFGEFANSSPDRC